MCAHTPRTLFWDQQNNSILPFGEGLWLFLLPYQPVLVHTLCLYDSSYIMQIMHETFFPGSIGGGETG